MKLSRIAWTVALVAMASLASAGNNTYNTTVSTSGGAGASAFWNIMSDPLAGGSQIDTFAIYYTDGSGGPNTYSGAPVYGLHPAGLDLPVSTDPINGTWGFVVNAFFDPNPDALNGDVTDLFPAVQDNLFQTASLTYGAGTYFAGVTGSGYFTNQHFFELDVNIVGAGPNGTDPGTPAGTWRLGFAVNVTGCNFDSLCGLPDTAEVTANLVGGNTNAPLTDTASGTPPNTDTGGDFVVLGNVGACSNENGCGAVLVLTDSQFDFAPIPEPTTLLLLGSGLMMIARRFRR